MMSYIMTCFMLLMLMWLSFQTGYFIGFTESVATIEAFLHD